MLVSCVGTSEISGPGNTLGINYSMQMGWECSSGAQQKLLGSGKL